MFLLQWSAHWNDSIIAIFKHKRKGEFDPFSVKDYTVDFVDLLFYVHGKHLRSCRDGQLI